VRIRLRSSRRGYRLASLVLSLALLSLTPSLAVQPQPGQWNISSGICGNPVSITTNNYGHVYAAVQSLNTNCAGVFRSTNGGQSFSKVGITNPGFSPPVIHDVGNTGCIYAATTQGVWKTCSQNQVTWTQSLNGLPNFTDIYMVEPIFGSFEVYATVDPVAPAGGLYRSLDGGNTWSLLKAGLDAVAVDRGFGCGLPAGNYIVAAARSDRGGLPGAVWISTDNGVNWSSAAGFPTNRAMDIAFSCQGGGNPSVALYVSNGDPSINAAVYRSANLGLSFSPDNNGIPTCCASTLAPTSDSQGYLGNVAATWSPVFNGAAGLFTRNGIPGLGAPWHQFNITGFPPGAPIVDWTYATDPATGAQRYVAIVAGGIMYFQP